MLRSPAVTHQGPQHRILSDSQVRDLHLASLDILERTGVQVGHPRMRDILKKAGARVDGDRVRLPPRLVEWALRSAPGKITVHNRLGEVAMRLERGKVYFGNSVDCPYFLEPETGRSVQSRREHVGPMTRLADALENISFINPGGMINDMPFPIANRLVLKDVVSNTIMPVLFDPRSRSDLEAAIEVAGIVVGGPDQLKAKPYLMLYFETLAPLFHPEDMLEILLLAAEHSLPIVYTPMSIGGATAPLSLAGNLAICNAEVLSSITFAQILNEGLPCIHGGIPGPMDMKTTRFPYCSPESMLLCAAFVELANFYDLPSFGTAGITDAVVVDAQAGAEMALNIHLAALTGANLVHDVAQIGGGDNTSPVALVLADELINMVKRLLRPVEITRESLGLEAIDAIGPRGNFLKDKTTLKQCRQVWSPEFFNRKGVEGWDKDGLSLEDKLKKRVREIWADYRPVPLPDKAAGLLEELERKWWNSL